MANGQTSVERSRAVNGRSPIIWQIELIDHVTWCSSAIRTRPAQKSAVSAPHHDLVTSPPISAGLSRLIAASGRKHAIDAADVGVGEQVGSEPCGISSVASEQPAGVRVQEASRQRGRGGSEQPRRVRVALPVGEGVMAAMVGDPVDDRALKRQAASDR
jgi:hypothetical protein